MNKRWRFFSLFLFVTFSDFSLNSCHNLIGKTGIIIIHFLRCSPNLYRYTHLKTVSEANSYLTESNTNESGSLFSHFVNKNCLFNFGEKFFEVKTLLFTISALPDFRTPFYTKRTEKRQKGQISRKKSRNTCAQFLFLKKNFRKICQMTRRSNTRCPIKFWR